MDFLSSPYGFFKTKSWEVILTLDIYYYTHCNTTKSELKWKMSEKFPKAMFLFLFCNVLCKFFVVQVVIACPY